MTEQRRDEVLESLTEIFGERVERSQAHDGTGANGALASVQPSDAEEIRLLAEVAAEHSVSLARSGEVLVLAFDEILAEDRSR